MIWTGTPRTKGLARLFEARRLLSLILVGAFVWSLTGVGWRDGILHTGGGGAIKNFSLALFSPELSPGFLKLALAASWLTVVHAVAGITVAIIVGVPLGIIASGS